MNWAAVYYRDATTRVALTEAHIAAGAALDPPPARALLNTLPLSPASRPAT